MAWRRRSEEEDELVDDMAVRARRGEGCTGGGYRCTPVSTGETQVWVARSAAVQQHCTVEVSAGRCWIDASQPCSLTRVHRSAVLLLCTTAGRAGP